MKDVVIASSVLTMMWAVVGIFMVWALLRIFDRVSGFDPRDTLQNIRSNANAAALYLGLRFLGACLLVGNVIS